MRTIEAEEAETRFGALLKEVENGETVIVTRDGQPVARVSPIGEERPGVAAAIETLHRYRREHRPTLGGMSIRELIEDGRRFEMPKPDCAGELQ
ncbi:MAG: type II toxin-antitoxin system Phd/YefM family antitoxin [Thermomicrobiales bacterium]